MKYLLVFFFAGFFLAETALIEKYKLSLELKEEGFKGTVKLTLSDLITANDVQFDSYNYNVTKCTYTGIKQIPKPSSTSNSKIISNLDNELSENLTTSITSTTSSTQTPAPPSTQSCEFKNNTIQFNGTRTGKDVVLEFEGFYSSNGLTRYGTESYEWLYVADMAKNDNHIIFPCQEKVKAEFEFEGNDVVMSNLEKKKDKDKKVFLRDLIFVRGDIVKSESIPSFAYYHMKKSGQMGLKLKRVMEKVAKLDASLQILFTQVELETSSPRDVIFLRDVLEPNDSKSDYTDIARKLTQEWFKRLPNEKNTFFDLVGPSVTEWKISDNYSQAEELQKLYQIHVLEEDGFNNSRSLNELASEHLKLIQVYTKGISVLYLLESICGDEKFMGGLSNYIKDGNSTVEEAFGGCFKDGNETRQFFQAWVYDPGYPVVHVILNKTAECNMNQERFLWFGDEQKDKRWILSIDYKTKEGSEKNIRLPASKGNVSEKINSTYIILNHNHKGFYRVNYDARVWEALITQLKSNHTQINPLSRMQLIDDVFSFPKSLYKFNHATPDYVTALKLSNYLRNETDLLPLQAAFKAFDFLDSALNSSYHGKFTDHVRGILKGIYNKIKDKTRSNTYEKFIQNKAVLLACKFGVEECIKNATAIYKNIKWNETQLSEQERNAICSAVRNDTAKWMDSFALLSITDLEPKEKIALLACSRDKTMLSLFLTHFISKKDKNGFKTAAISAMESNPDNIKVIMDIIKHLDGTIINLWGNECLEEIVEFTLPKLNSETANTIKKFKTNLNEKLQKKVDSACKNIEVWTNTKAKSLGEYFKGSGSQAKPIALISLVITLIPLANHIFHN